MAKATAKEDCHLIIVLAFSIKELTDKYPELLEKIKQVIDCREKVNKEVIY
jgi:hypothetical protein